MPTRPLFAGGVGFSPGSVRYMPTLGLTPAGAATELSITCHGLPNSLHVQVEFEDEGWTGTAVSGFVEVYVNGAWHDGTALFESYYAEGVYEQHELHGCIFGLQPNTTYPVRVTFRRYDVSEETSWAVGPNGLEDSGFDVVEEQVHEVEGTTAVDQPTFAATRVPIYIRTDGQGDDGNDGSSLEDAVETLGRVKQLVNGQAGRDIYYVGKCDFELGSANQLENIDGAVDNWNSLRPYEPGEEEDPELAGEIIGYVEVDDTWTHVEQDIYKVSLDKPVGRVQYYDENLLQWRLLQGCRVYDGADQVPGASTVSTLALKTGPKKSGPVDGIVYGVPTSGKFTIERVAHGLSAGQWVTVWGVKADPEQAWTNELEGGIHEVLSVPDADHFVIDAGVPGIYTSGGNWESQKMAGFYYKPSTEELFVRLPDYSQPASGKIRAGYKSALFIVGRTAPTPNGPRYVYFDLRCGLAGSHSDDSTDSLMKYCNSVSNFGAVQVYGARDCIFTGSFNGSGILGGAADPTGWQDCLVDGATFANDGPYDYIIGRAKANTPRMWETMDDAAHFNIAFQVYRHDGSIWPPGVHLRRAERVAMRNVVNRSGEPFQAGGGAEGSSDPTIRDVRYVDVYGCEFANVYHTIGLSDNYAVSVAIYHNQIVKGYLAMDVSPTVAGPVWYVGNHYDETFLKLSKQGDGTNSRGHAFVIFVNNCVYDDRDTALEGTGVVSWHGRHSGAIASNNAYSYTAATHRPVVFMNPSYSGSVASGRINYHENNYYFTRNLGRPEAVATSHAHFGGLGTNHVGTSTNTTARDGTLHSSRSVDDGGVEKIDSRYTFNVGEGNVAKQVIWKGRIHGAGSGLVAPDNAQSMVWNNTSSGWDVLYNEYKSNGSVVEKGHALLAAHTASNGDVVIRFRGEGDDQWLNTIDFIAVNHGLLSWGGTYYADFAAMTSALEGDTAQFLDQQIVTEELIDDESGLVVTAYAEEGVYIRGITNIASLGDGQLEYDALGYFTEFSYEPPE